MIKRTAILLVGYFMLMLLLYFAVTWDPTTPSNFTRLALIATVAYIIVSYLLIKFAKKRTNETKH